MSKQAFRIEGDFQMGRVRQHFSVEMIGTDEDSAREALYTDLGSRHSVARREIAIQSVAPIAPADVVDPIVKHKLGA